MPRARVHRPSAPWSPCPGGSVAGCVSDPPHPPLCFSLLSPQQRGSCGCSSEFRVSSMGPEAVVPTSSGLLGFCRVSLHHRSVPPSVVMLPVGSPAVRPARPPCGVGVPAGSPHAPRPHSVCRPKLQVCAVHTARCGFWLVFFVVIMLIAVLGCSSSRVV